jgi:hypothetical protein
MPAGVSAYVALANVTLGSSAATVTFSSIGASYRDLVLIADNSPSSDSNLWLQFNGDTTAANYRTVTVGGNGSGTYSATYTSGDGFNAIVAPGGGYGSAAGSIVRINIMDYSATDKHKTVLIRADKASAGTEALAGRWGSTAAINSIRIMQLNTSRLFAAGTSFALYGIAS